MCKLYGLVRNAKPPRNALHLTARDIEHQIDLHNRMRSGNPVGRRYHVTRHSFWSGLMLRHWLAASPEKAVLALEVRTAFEAEAVRKLGGEILGPDHLLV